MEIYFWKKISKRKYDFFRSTIIEKLYLNKGYFDIKINSSFAKMINEEEFELIFNIQANKKFIFNNLTLTLPTDFEEKIF